MAGLSAGPAKPIGTAPMPGTSGYMGGGNPYNPSAQYGSTWSLPTGDVMQSTFTPTKNPQTGMLEGGNWSVNPAGRSLEGQEFDFNKQRWGDVLGMMDSAMRGFGSSGGSSLGAEIAPPTMPGRTPTPTWTPDSGVSAQAFARSKDNVGRMMRAAQTEIGDEFGARGIGGSGLEAKAIAALRNAGLNSLAQGEFQRDLANEGRQFDMTKFGAGLSSAERAMDINALNNIYATQVTQRGQQANDPRIAMLSSLMSSIGGMY